MPRVSAAAAAFHIAYRQRIRRKALQALTKNPAGLSVKCLAAIVGVSVNGLDNIIRAEPELEKSHPEGRTWYRLKPADSGYSPPAAPRA